MSVTIILYDKDGREVACEADFPAETTRDWDRPPEPEPLGWIRCEECSVSSAAEMGYYRGSREDEAFQAMVRRAFLRRHRGCRAGFTELDIP